MLHRGPIRTLPDEPVRNERPAHTPRTQHSRNHDPSERLTQTFIHRAPLPLRTEQQSIPQPPTPHRHRLQQLTVVILRCHG